MFKKYSKKSHYRLFHPTEIQKSFREIVVGKKCSFFIREGKHLFTYGHPQM